MRARERHRDRASKNRDEFAPSHCLSRGSGQGIVSTRGSTLKGVRRETANVRFVPIADIASVHSITSLARASMDGGTARPRALAVLRLMTSSNFVGCCAGRSAGFAPLRMRININRCPLKHISNVEPIG